MGKILQRLVFAVGAVFTAAALQGCVVAAGAAAGTAAGYAASENGYEVQSPVKQDKAGGYKFQSPVTHEPKDQSEN